MRKDRTNQAQYLKPTVFIFGFMNKINFKPFQSKCFEQETALITTEEIALKPSLTLKNFS